MAEPQNSSATSKVNARAIQSEIDQSKVMGAANGNTYYYLDAGNGYGQIFKVPTNDQTSKLTMIGSVQVDKFVVNPAEQADFSKAVGDKTASSFSGVTPATPAAASPPAANPLNAQAAPTATASSPTTVRDPNGAIRVHYEGYPSAGKTTDYVVQVSPVDGTPQMFRMDIKEAGKTASTSVTGRIINGQPVTAQIAAMDGDKTVSIIHPQIPAEAQQISTLGNYEAMSKVAFQAAGQFNSANPWAAPAKPGYNSLQTGVGNSLQTGTAPSSANPIMDMLAQATRGGPAGEGMTILPDGTFRFPDKQHGWTVDDKFDGNNFHEMAKSTAGGKVEVNGQIVNGELAINRIRIDETIRDGNGKIISDVHQTLDHDAFLKIINNQAVTDPATHKLVDKQTHQPILDADTHQPIDPLCMNYPKGVLANANRAIKAYNDNGGPDAQPQANGNQPAGAAPQANGTAPQAGGGEIGHDPAAQKQNQAAFQAGLPGASSAWTNQNSFTYNDHSYSVSVIDGKPISIREDGGKTVGSVAYDKNPNGAVTLKQMTQPNGASTQISNDQDRNTPAARLSNARLSAALVEYLKHNPLPAANGPTASPQTQPAGKAPPVKPGQNNFARPQ